jgi:hypothetical protein
MTLYSTTFRGRAMKSAGRVFLVFCAGLVILVPGLKAAGQNKSVLDCYRLLKPDMLGGIQFVFEKKDSIWVTSSPRTESELDCVVDLKNGFIRVSDPGTGGGTVTQEIGLFHDARGQSYIGVNITTFDGVRINNTCTFYRWTGKGWAAAAVLPSVPYAQFFSPGYDPAPVKDMLALSYQLPRRGTAVKVTLDLSNLQKAERVAMGPDPARAAAAKKALANVAFGSIELVWAMDRGAFFIGKKLK